MQGAEEFSNHHGEEDTEWPDNTTLSIDPGAQQRQESRMELEQNQRNKQAITQLYNQLAQMPPDQRDATLAGLTDEQRTAIHGVQMERIQRDLGQMSAWQREAALAHMGPEMKETVMEHQQTMQAKNKEMHELKMKVGPMSPIQRDKHMDGLPFELKQRFMEEQVAEQQAMRQSAEMNAMHEKLSEMSRVDRDKYLAEMPPNKRGAMMQHQQFMALNTQLQLMPPQQQQKTIESLAPDVRNGFIHFSQMQQKLAMFQMSPEQRQAAMKELLAAQEAAHQAAQEVPSMIGATQMPRRPRKTPIGNSVKRCGGLCIQPSGSSAGLSLTGLILFPVLVFLTSVIPPTEIFSFVIVISLTVLVITIHFFAVCCDPGIIPENPDRNAPPVQPGFITLADGTKVQEKVCSTCNIIRPPRSSHCINCDYCVEEYDHHCGFVGSCVAQRTFRFFTLLFYCICPLALYIFIRSVLALNDADWASFPTTSDWGRWRIVAAMGCTLYSACFGSCALGNGIMYTNFACANSTAKLRGQMAGTGTVYTTEHADREYSCSACCTRLFGPIPKSRI